MEQIDYLQIHHMLHNEHITHTSLGDGRTVYVQQHVKNRYRFADCGDVIVMQQNIMKASRYADRARRGERISWIIPKYPNKGPWKIIDDNFVKNNTV